MASLLIEASTMTTAARAAARAAGRHCHGDAEMARIHASHGGAVAMGIAGAPHTRRLARCHASRMCVYSHVLLNRPEGVDMRVAVLSDVHGNADSLRAVLDDVDRWGPDLLVSAGDVAAHGPCPEEAVDMLRSREVLHVRGNNDRYLATEGATGPPGRDEADTAERTASLEWTRARLGPETLAFLGSLPAQQEIDGMTVVHASVGNDEAGLWPSTPEVQMCSGWSGTLVCGHTHRPFVRRVPCGQVVNVGSAGWNLDGDTRPSWAALVRKARGNWQATTRRVTYDSSRTLAELERRQVPWRNAVAHYIRTASWRPISPLSVRE